jgi:hypothetical protein
LEIGHVVGDSVKYGSWGKFLVTSLFTTSGILAVAFDDSRLVEAGAGCHSAFAKNHFPEFEHAP